jgi:exodeoxyribonuclease VII small subunit
MSARGGEPGDLGFDATLARLREVVERLESGNLSLEDSLAVYEEGVKLARRGHELLDGAEKRVELLVSAAGAPATVPFEAEEVGGS